MWNCSRGWFHINKEARKYAAKLRQDGMGYTGNAWFIWIGMGWLGFGFRPVSVSLDLAVLRRCATGLYIITATRASLSVASGLITGGGV